MTKVYNLDKSELTFFKKNSIIAFSIKEHLPLNYKLEFTEEIR